MSEGTVRLEIEESIAYVTFDRPEARNAMTWAMYSQLGAVCDMLRGNERLRCVVFRGAGKEAFVAGTDIEQFRAFRSDDDGVAYEKRIDEGIARIESLPMPTLAAIDGWCVGGGLAIATACDIRIGTASAKFGVPIARTLGNCLSMTNAARLVAAWGKARVQRMLIGAEILDATEARACGFLADIAPADLDKAAEARARQLAALAPITQAVSKEALRRLLVRDVPEAEDLIRRAYGSADFHEGVTAFNEKRAPAWRGR